MAVESYVARSCEAQNTFSRLATRQLSLIKFQSVLQNGNHIGKAKCIEPCSRGLYVRVIAYNICIIRLLMNYHKHISRLMQTISNWILNRRHIVGCQDLEH